MPTPHILQQQVPASASMPLDDETKTIGVKSMVDSTTHLDDEDDDSETKDQVPDAFHPSTGAAAMRGITVRQPSMRRTKSVVAMSGYDEQFRLDASVFSGPADDIALALKNLNHDAPSRRHRAPGVVAASCIHAILDFLHHIGHYIHIPYIPWLAKGKLQEHKAAIGADVVAGIICGIMLIPQGKSQGGGGRRKGRERGSVMRETEREQREGGRAGEREENGG